MTKRKRKKIQTHIHTHTHIYIYIYIYITIYDKRNALSLQQKEAVLVAFRISKLRELKNNLGPWKLMENFLILVLHCGKSKSSELLVP